MAQVHRLPDTIRDDRRVIDVTVGDVVGAVVERLHEAGLGQGDSRTKPLDKNGLMEHYRVSDDQVYKWRNEGAPCFCTGDEKGLRAYVADMDAWLKARKIRG